MMSTSQDQIQITGARVHNLKNISLSIPKNKLVVITGPSGSGKSSLAFDLIYAESQRRFIESLSTNARQFLEVLERPDVDSISGLAPAIALRQQQAQFHPNSNVASVSEIQDYLQILFAKLASPKCKKCKSTLSKRSLPSIISELFALEENSKIQLLIPCRKSKKNLDEGLKELRRQGFVRVRLDGKTYLLDETDLPSQSKEVEVVYDRLILKSDIRERLAASVEECLKIAAGHLKVLIESPAQVTEERDYSNHFFCSKCLQRVNEIEPRELHVGSEAAKNFYFHQQSFDSLCKFSIQEFANWIEELELLEFEQKISKPLFAEILKRTSCLKSFGLANLVLSHNAQHLSTGEAQRIRLAQCLSSDLSGVLYILDEPSLGLDSEQVEYLISTLRQLKDRGNSLIVVEHDVSIIKSADHIIELGPDAGDYGGEIVAQGDRDSILASTQAKTARILNSKFRYFQNNEKRKQTEFLELKNVNYKSLKNLSLKIPRACFSVISGRSGSGKSLLLEYLYNNKAECIENTHYLDQSGIGNSPRSNPASYLDILSYLRELLASTEEARLRGYKLGRFSFNTKGGRCETCEGMGQIQIDMKFLADVYVSCLDCHGKRFNRETLEIRFKGYNISEILELSVEEALIVFQNIPKIAHKLRKLREVGLGYIKLGQAANTLSGGEAQRVKLAKELAKRQTGNTLYLFDEPTQGLFAEDVNKLLVTMHQLVDLGNTVVVAEHDLGVIESADCVIELGA